MYIQAKYNHLPLFLYMYLFSELTIVSTKINKEELCSKEEKVSSGIPQQQTALGLLPTMIYVYVALSSEVKIYSFEDHR